MLLVSCLAWRVLSAITLSQSKKDEYGYEHELWQLLEKLVGECDKRISRANERIKRDLEHPLYSVEDSAKLEGYKAQIKLLTQQTEDAAEAGDIDTAQASCMSRMLLVNIALITFTRCCPVLLVLCTWMHTEQTIDMTMEALQNLHAQSPFLTFSILLEGHLYLCTKVWRVEIFMFDPRRTMGLTYWCSILLPPSVLATPFFVNKVTCLLSHNFLFSSVFALTVYCSAPTMMLLPYCFSNDSWVCRRKSWRR